MSALERGLRERTARMVQLEALRLHKNESPNASRATRSVSSSNGAPGDPATGLLPLVKHDDELFRPVLQGLTHEPLLLADVIAAALP